jgi:hypothetical protein
MKRMGLIASGIAAVAGAALAIAPAAGSTSTPLTIVYDTTSTTHQLVFPRGGHGLSPIRGALRQDPGLGGMFAPGNNAPYRVAKVSGATLYRMSVSQMASTLERSIMRGKYGAEAHLVTVDELMETFGDPGTAGIRFSDAMRILASQQSPWGGTWASRVEVFVAPGIVSSIAMGRGPQHNLAPNGRRQYRSWTGVMPGIALAGGVHLEMYHGSGAPLTAFSASQWRRSPGAFLDLLSRYGGSASKVHLVFTSTTVPAGAPRGWGDAMEASWSLARSTAAGRTLLANGPDAYRLGRRASEWLREFNRSFPG